MKKRPIEEVLDERFHPVQREVAALVTEMRMQGHSYQQLGLAVAKIERSVANVERIVTEWDAAIRRGPTKPKPQPKKSAKLIQFKKPLRVIVKDESA